MKYSINMYNDTNKIKIKKGENKQIKIIVNIIVD